MNTERIVKEARFIISVSLIVGLALLAAGIIFTLTDTHIISNNRALIGLSLIPLGVASLYYLKLSKIKKSPQDMKAIMIDESDERLTAIRNEALAKAHKIVQAAIFLTYMGYTLMVPEDIFESVGWWILLLLMLISFFSQAILLAIAMTKETAINDETE